MSRPQHATLKDHWLILQPRPLFYPHNSFRNAKDHLVIFQKPKDHLVIFQTQDLLVWVGGEIIIYL